MPKPTFRIQSQKMFVLVAIFFLLSLAGIPLMAIAYDSWYEGKIMPGVLLENRAVGGLSEEYATDILNNYNEHLQTDGAVFIFKGKKIVLYPETVSLSSDIPKSASSAPLFAVKTTETVNALSSIGRTGTVLDQQYERLRTALFKTRMNPLVSLDAERITEQLKKEFSFFHTPAKNASYALDEQDAFIIIPETRGVEFNYTAALASLEMQTAKLSSPIIELKEGVTTPSIGASDLETMRASVYELVKYPLVLRFDDMVDDQPKLREWIFSRTTLVSWLLVEKKPDGSLSVGVDEKVIAAELAKRIAPDVRIEVRHPRFEMKNGKVVAFDVPQNGRELDATATARAISVALKKPERIAFLTVKETISPFQNTGAEQGIIIKELLARADTDFSGSPTNRRKNIIRGTELLNGILIAPGEEFSTLKALGKIDGTNGFLPELVIKGTKTTPEFGGGLCQVSTTLFRAIAFAGLEILERKSHTYRVPYYEPPVGFDATIYDPSPDLRFKNDTLSYILIQTRVSKNKMIVELWGTKDGRKVEVDTPTVFNIKKAGPTKIIETDELKPGEKKCTERAHDGAEAVFERRVTFADGTTKKETYRSKYVVWPAVCLVGKEQEINQDVIVSPKDEWSGNSQNQQDSLRSE